MHIVFFDSDFDRFGPLVQYKPWRIHVGCCIHLAFLIPKHPWQEEGSCRFSLAAERQFCCCVWLEFCSVSRMLSGCKVWIQLRWVYCWSWRSVLQVSGFVNQRQSLLNYIHILHPDNIWVTHWNAGQTKHQKRCSTTKENLQLPSNCQRYFRIKDARCMQHPTWMRQGLYWTKRSI